MVGKIDLEFMLDESGVCVFRPPFSIPCLDYEVVGFQTQAVDITNLGSVHTLSAFSSSSTPKIHAINKTELIKDIH